METQTDITPFVVPPSGDTHCTPVLTAGELDDNAVLCRDKALITVTQHIRIDRSDRARYGSAGRLHLCRTHALALLGDKKLADALRPTLVAA